MRFATWSVHFPQNSREGITPDTIIRERGGEAFGLVFTSDFSILGTFSDNADVSGLDNYVFKEITQDKALEIINDKDPGAAVNRDGEITFSPYIKQ